jgi:hypothetical protein
MKPTEQIGHPFHVLRAVSALNEAVVDNLHVGRRLLQFETRFLVPERSLQSLLVIAVVLFGACGSIPKEIVNCLFLLF